MRAKAIGIMIWPIIIIIGTVGWLIWNWYVAVLALIAGIIFGYMYSIIESKRIERITGLNIREQEEAFKYSLAAKNDPIARNPRVYRQYIDSIPD